MCTSNKPKGLGNCLHLASRLNDLYQAMKYGQTYGPSCFDLKQNEEDAGVLVVRVGRKTKVFGSAEGRLIDFLDIGLSLASEVLFPLSSDYLCAL